MTLLIINYQVPYYIYLVLLCVYTEKEHITVVVVVVHTTLS